MAKLELATPLGRWRLVAEHEDLVAPAVEIAACHESNSAEHDGLVEFAGRRARFRCAPIAGAARIASAWMPPRSLREHANLVWLRDRLFQVPAPLAAGMLVRGGWPSFEFSLCEEIPDVLPWARARTTSGRESESLAEEETARVARERARIAEELARELARMHALRFVHGDLTPEHVLVGPREHAARVHFVPSRRGGPRLTTRGAWRDLARFAADARAFEPAELDRFLAIYVEERRAQGRPVEKRSLGRVISAHASVRKNGL